jgi:hypothetical protein
LWLYFRLFFNTHEKWTDFNLWFVKTAVNPIDDDVDKSVDEIKNSSFWIKLIGQEGIVYLDTGSKD